MLRQIFLALTGLVPLVHIHAELLELLFVSVEVTLLRLGLVRHLANSHTLKRCAAITPAAGHLRLAFIAHGMADVLVCMSE